METFKNKTYHFKNFIFMFLLLGVTAMPIIRLNDIISIILSIVLIFWFVTTKRQFINKEFYFIVLLLLILVVFQSFIFNFFKLETIVGLFIRVWIGYAAVKYFGLNFIPNYLVVMRLLTKISLIIFIPIYLFPNLHEYIIQTIPDFLSYKMELWGSEFMKKSIVIYNFNMIDSSNLIRNCGPFWEPGAFGGFLLIAFMFNSVREKRLFTKLNFLFFFALITTQSTTAYLALFVFILGYYLSNNFSLKTMLLLISLLISGIFAFNQIPFLGRKISDESESIEYAINEKEGNSRLASAVLDLNDISQFPYTGRGIWDETRVDKKFEFVARNNGLTNILAQWGIGFSFIYFFFYFKSINFYCQYYESSKLLSSVILLTIWILSFGEVYFNLVFFWSLLFLFTSYSNSNIPQKP